MPGESFIQGLRKLDPNLVSNAKNDLTVFASYTVLEGEIGKALHHGRTKFYGPGNYGPIGPGKEWLGTEKLRKEGDDIVVHQVRSHRIDSSPSTSLLCFSNPLGRDSPLPR